MQERREKVKAAREEKVQARRNTLYALYWAGEPPEAINALVGICAETLEKALTLYSEGKVLEAAEVLSESVPRVLLFSWEDLEPLTLNPDFLFSEEELPEALLEKGEAVVAGPLSLVLPSPQDTLTLLVTFYPAGGMVPPASFTLFVPQERLKAEDARWRP